MPAKKKDSSEEKEDKVVSTQDLVAGLLDAGKVSHYNFDAPENSIISTGSMNLDAVIRVRAGSTIRLCGEGAEVGKTSQCLVFAGEYMKTIPKSRTIFFTAESRLSPEIQARSGHRFVTNTKDWEYGTVLIVRSNVFEFIADMMEKVLKSSRLSGDRFCMIVDSLDGLILEDDLGKASVRDNTMVAGVPKLTKLLFRRIGLLNWAADGLLIMTSQYSTNIKIDTYAKDIPRQGSASGGSSAGHQSDYTLMYLTRYGKDLILENPELKQDRFKNKLLGVYAPVEIRKSATEETGTVVRVPIKKGRIGNQIWVEKEVSDLVVAYEFVKKAGSWLSFPPSLIEEAAGAGVELVEKVQGIKKLDAYLEENPKVFTWLKGKLTTLINEIQKTQQPKGD